MSTTTTEAGRTLYEQCRELGWSRERACKASGVPVPVAEKWDAPIDRVLRQRAERAERGTVLRRRRRPTRYLGAVTQLPSDDDTEDVQ